MDGPYAAAAINFKDRKIRLLRLEPSNNPGHIKCSLLPHALTEDGLFYDAISYNWSSSGNFCQIGLNEVAWSVGRNV
jgi:hypothetical protein